MVQTPGSPSRNLIGNVSGLGGFSIMTPSINSLNAPGSNTSNQLSASSNMLGHLPSQQVLPSVIGKSNSQSNARNFINFYLYVHIIRINIIYS